MEFKYVFTNEKEKEDLINKNSHLTLIKIAYHLDENYLIFTDEEIIYELTENEILGNKISILEAENENLKEGLRAILRGDMQSLAYILYPEDFNTFQKAGV
nr:MAG TPA: hypothetical protein [Caudoviricetes sp.]